MNADALAETIRRRRRELGVDQRKLASLADVSVHTVSDIESGKGNPTLSTVAAILAALGLELAVEAKAPAGRGIHAKTDGEE